MRPFFEGFQIDYPRAKTYQEKMVLVDQLIHRFHGELNSRDNRAGCVNLIQGKHRDVIDFLDTLTYGEGNTQSLTRVKEKWKKIINHKGKRKTERKPC